MAVILIVQFTVHKFTVFQGCDVSEANRSDPPTLTAGRQQNKQKTRRAATATVRAGTHGSFCTNECDAGTSRTLY